MSRFFLIHSPLVGPTTWKWVSEELRGMNHEVAIPVMSSASINRGWEAVVEEVAAQVSGSGEAIFVAHSGAGPILPHIVAQSGSPASSMVFVDAGVPSTTADTPLMPDALLDELALNAVDGVLPPWSEWFGPGVMASLVPDSNQRSLVESELPRVPLSYLRGTVPPVQSWPTQSNGYVLLSDGYLNDAEEARRRGWSVLGLSGAHLDLITRASEVALAIVQAASSI